ncbi:MAG TPA: molybdopterin-synthase adenylyltransferase MoeB [Chthoniobacterales bacterium]|nr:molybdopterin-synthase adenylyltransferase MoeB [Chthoniobacterales bacterium]
MNHSIIDEARAQQSEFGAEERLRYSRHLIMPEVTLAGQKRLKASRVLCIGAGGLGSPTALYLGAAGVGTLGLVDVDVVDLSNLQRQLLHGTADVGRPKLDSARDRIREANPHVHVELYPTRFTSENATQIIEDYDVVIDGSDNFPTRYLSSDACVFARKPNIYGSVFRFDGQATVFAPHLGGPCYRCLFPEPPPLGAVPNCAEAGVLGVLPGVVGMMQAIEAIKLILGLGESLLGRLLHFDALKMKFREFKLRRDPACPVCGENPSISELQDYELFCGAVGQNAETNGPGSLPSISVHELKQRREMNAPLTLIDVREPYELELARIEGAKLIPLGQIEERAGEIDRRNHIVVFCHAGVRSARAVQILQRSGFTNIFNLEGGIDAWSEQVDPSVPRY